MNFVDFHSSPSPRKASLLQTPNLPATRFCRILAVYMKQVINDKMTKNDWF